MDDTPDTRASLLVRLGDARDDLAWTEFVRIYAPFIKRLARRRGLQEADAEDLAQDVFRAVARAIEERSYDSARGSFRGWLFRIARNLVINFLIHRDRHPQGSGDTGVNGFLNGVPSREDSAIFEAEYRRQLLHWAAEQVRGEFTDLTWQAFWQAGVQGRSAKDVATALGTTIGTVYHCKSRVMARLRQVIETVQDHADLP